MSRRRGGRRQRHGTSRARSAGNRARSQINSGRCTPASAGRAAAPTKCSPTAGRHASRHRRSRRPPAPPNAKRPRSSGSPIGAGSENADVAQLRSEIAALRAQIVANGDELEPGARAAPEPRRHGRRAVGARRHERRRALKPIYDQATGEIVGYALEASDGAVVGVEVLAGQIVGANVRRCAELDPAEIGYADELEGADDELELDPRLEDYDARLAELEQRASESVQVEYVDGGPDLDVAADDAAGQLQFW